MRDVKALFAIVGLAAASGFAGTAAAQMPQMSMSSAYIGGSLGQSDLGDACSGGCTDDKDAAWKIFGGYQFNRNFAVELGYTHLGEVPRSPASGGGTLEAMAWELVGIGMLPLANQFSIYGKLGIARGEVEISGSAAGFGLSDTSTDLTYGIGAQYDFTKQLGVRAEWQRYDFDQSVDVMSVGIVFRFQ